MRRAITFLEIVFVLVVVGILLAIAIPKYLVWQKRVGVEDDTRRIYSELELQRMQTEIIVADTNSMRLAPNLSSRPPQGAEKIM
jgi:type II secretory pathway pseudopilin PulG